jgi:hypothetical protein
VSEPSLLVICPARHSVLVPESCSIRRVSNKIDNSLISRLWHHHYARIASEWSAGNNRLCNIAEYCFSVSRLNRGN